MADNPLKYSELVAPDNSILDAITQLTQLGATYDDTLKKVRTSAAQLESDVKSLSGATQDQRDKIKQTATETDVLATAQKNLSFAQSETAKQLVQLKQQQNEQNTINKLTAQLNNSAAGSYNALTAQYSLNKIQLNQMDIAQLSTTESGKKLQTETKEIYMQMKAYQESTGKAQLNVGNYNGALNELGNTLGMLPGPLGATAMGVSNLGTQLKALLLNPVVAIIAAIAGALYLMYEATVRTETGQNKFNMTMTVGHAVYDSVMNDLDKLINGSEEVTDKMGKMNQQTETWFQRTIQNLKGVGIAFLFSLPIVQSTMKAYGTQISDSVANGIDLANKQAEADKKERELMLANSEMTKQSAKMRADATELRKTDAKAGLDLMNQSMSLDSKVAQNELTIAKEHQSIQQMKFDMGKKDKDALKDLNDANIAVNSAEEKYDEQRTARVRKMNAMRTEDLTQEKARSEAQLKINTLDVADIIRTNDQIITSDKYTYDQKEKALKENYDLTSVERKNTLDKELTDLENQKNIKLISATDYELQKSVLIKTYNDTQTAATEKYNLDELKQTEVHKTDMLAEQDESIKLQLVLVKKGSDQENALKLQQIENSRQKELLANSLKKKDLQVADTEINAAYDKESTDQNTKFINDKALLEFDQQQALDQSAFDLLTKTEAQKTQFKLQAEKDRLNEILLLNETASDKMTDVQVMTIKNGIIKINEEIAKSQKTAKPQDVYSLVGLNLTDAAKTGITDSTNFAIGQVTNFLAAKVQAAEAAVTASNTEVDATQKQYDAEVTARANGYASNVASSKAALDLAKKNQTDALNEQRQAQKAQATIQSLEQVSSLVTASAKIWGELGFPWALPALAVMWGSFAAAKVEASKITSYGEGGFEVLEGGSHASGKDIGIGKTRNGNDRRAEGGEMLAIIQKSKTQKYRHILPDIINSLNHGIFEEKYLQAYGMDGMTLNVNAPGSDLNELERDVRQIREQGERRYLTNGKGQLIEIYKNLTITHR